MITWFFWVQQARPKAILDLITSGESFRIGDTAQLKLPSPGNCTRCNYISSQPVCKACVLLEGLNSGQPRLGVARTRGSKKKGSSAPLGATPLLAASPQDSQAAAAPSPSNTLGQQAADAELQDSRAHGLHGGMNGASSSPMDHLTLLSAAVSRQDQPAAGTCSCKHGVCRNQHNSSKPAAADVSEQLNLSELATAVETSGVSVEESGVFASAASLAQTLEAADHSAASQIADGDASSPHAGEHGGDANLEPRTEAAPSSKGAQSESQQHMGDDCCAGTSCSAAAHGCWGKDQTLHTSDDVAARLTHLSL